MTKMIVSLAVCCFTLFTCTTAETFSCASEWQPDLINVHVVPHTHDDPGWLKTVDQYYYGSNNRFANRAVKLILNTVHQELVKDPKRRFSYCEMSFFWRWWNEQDEATRTSVKQLVDEERLQFINAGWVMNDEAASHYVAIIDQMSYGLRMLNDTFGPSALPIAAWQIDPFGHSRTHADLIQRMGFESLYFARLHFIDYNERKNNSNMQLSWTTCDKPQCSSKRSLLTSHFYEYRYGPPSGLCWDQGCGDDPIMDDPRLEDNNVEEMVGKITKYATEQAKHYKVAHVMFLMGDDFNYMNANKNFENMDKMIKYVNQKQATGSKIHMFYSTPNCYTRALQQSKVTWQPKTDDFFPYASGAHTYWTGYFTSRPAFKAYIRQSSALLQTCTALELMSNSVRNSSSDLLARAVAVAQHHDGVSGTAKQHTTNDYTLRLSNGQMECQNVLNEAYGTLLNQKPDTSVLPTQYFCPMANISVCEISQGSQPFTVTVFNRVARTVFSELRIPLNHSAATVLTGQFQTLKSAVVDTFPSPSSSQLQYAPDRAPFELVLPVKLPPLGAITVLVVPQSAKTHPQPQPLLVEPLDKPNTLDTLQNKFVRVSVDLSTCAIQSISDLANNVSAKVSQELLYYESAKGAPGQPSGAYIFRPNSSATYPVTNMTELECHIVKNDVAEELRVTLSDWGTVVIRVSAGQPYVELLWTVGPLPWEDFIGREVIMRLQTDINNQDKFTTDANGRQLLMRTRNHQDTYTYDNSEPIAGNYYPINTHANIKDPTRQLTILTDRSHGGSSLKSGQLEIMLHRRMFYDDHFGVDEPLNEPGVDGRGLVVTGSFWMLLTPPAKASQLYRPLAIQKLHSPLSTFAELPPAERDMPLMFLQQIKTTYSGMRTELAPNVHLLSLQWLGPNTALIRLEHIFAANEDAKWSKPAEVDIQDLLSMYKIQSVTELMLAGDRPTKTNKELQSTKITLEAFDIRTFSCVIH